MIDTPNPKGKIYEIRLEGRLKERWAKWFDGLVITSDEKGNTLLSGPVADQAALHGLLKKIRDLGIPLISLNTIESDSEEVRES